MIDTIYFDNWNTLVQAPDLMRRGSSTETFHGYLESRGVDVPYGVFAEVYRPIARRHTQEADADSYRELYYEKSIERAFAELGLEDAEELARGAWKAYLDEWPRHTEFFPETPRVLNSLRGRYKLGVITNYMDGHTCQLVFDKLGYREIFDTLVVSAEVGYRKPSRVIFEQALKETESRPESCVMVGDMYEADIVGANNMGMNSILIDVYNNQHEHYGEATVAIKDISELPAALEEIIVMA
jgi:HAD superfamily hydrolase (TIGR01549 family)